MSNAKKLLITGGGGFIARNLSEKLGGEFNLFSVNRQELDLLDGEKVFAYIKNGRFDVVIHAATYDAAPKHSTKDPTRVIEYNLKMFFNLARCNEYFGKMIYFGSGAEFGREHWIPRMEESYFDRHVPADQYGFSKYIMTKHAQASANIYNLRLFGVFGKYDDWRTRFIPNACGHAIFDLPIRIDQDRAFDFIYIDDLVKIVKWFINNQPQQKVYNVCTGQSVDFSSIAETILKLSGKKLPIDIKTPGLGREYSGDNSWLIEEVKGFEFNPLKASLKALYDWHDANKDLIDKDKL